MATSLVPVEWRLHCARQFIESVTEDANTAWYVWVGDHVTTGPANNVYDMVLDTHVNAYRSMVFGKRIGSSDLSPMIRRIPWVSGTVYDMYDHGDPLIHQKDFYAVVDEGSYSHVFKCLDNNNGAESTIAPSFADIDASDEVYQTSDGYRWKYMYSVDRSTVDRFATSSYFPVVANTAVVDRAVPGAIDVVRVYEGGAGYENYLTGTFDAAHIRVNGNTLIYSLAGNTLANPVAGFYTGCILYVSSGTGNGGYRRVVDYFSNADGKFVRLESNFDVSPQNGSEWELYPEVVITGGGDQSSNAAARALINAVANAVYRVEMLSRGSDYTYATAQVVANAVVGVDSVANVVPVYSPPGGHGADVAAELGATRAGVSVRFGNTENGTIPATNGFRTVGMMRDPTFANVQINSVDPTTSTFFPDESVARYDTIALTSVGNVSANGVLVQWPGGDWTTRLDAGDQLVIVSDNLSQLLTVTSVQNATHIAVNSAIQFTCTAAQVYLAEVTAGETKILSQTSANTFLVDTNAQLTQGDQLIGVSSGARATISQVNRNGVDKEFSTFVQCWKYVGSYVSGAFQEDEFVYSGNSLTDASAKAQVHSATTSDGQIVLLTSNQIGSFSVGDTVKGVDSQAIFTISAKYSPEIKHGSGRVTYVENVDPVTRTPIQTESFRLILEF